jgi:hypothetical protein
VVDYLDVVYWLDGGVVKATVMRAKKKGGNFGSYHRGGSTII